MQSLFIISCTVCRQDGGPDCLSMEVALPNGCWPFTGRQWVKMDVAHGTAEEYIKKNLPNLQYKTVDS